jgi:hypothetical protein
VTGELSGPVQEQPNLEVDCYSGYKADERPVRFQLEERQYCICTVLDQWREPEGIFYRVRADDGRVYVLRQNSTLESSWDLVSSD